MKDFNLQIVRKPQARHHLAAKWSHTDQGISSVVSNSLGDSSVEKHTLSLQKVEIIDA
jgi:hypothetical protein